MSSTTHPPNYEQELHNINVFLNSKLCPLSSDCKNYKKSDQITFYNMCQKLIRYYKENNISIPIYDSSNNTINELTIGHIIVSFSPSSRSVSNIFEDKLPLLNPGELELYNKLIEIPSTPTDFNLIQLNNTKVSTSSPTISTTTKIEEDEDIGPDYSLVKDRIYNKILKYITDNKLTNLVTNKEISAMIDEQLVSSNFNTTSDDTIIEIVKFLIKKKQPSVNSSCNMNINIDIIDKNYKEVINHYQKQNPQLKSKEIVKKIYDKGKNIIDTLDCLSQSVFYVKIIPLMDKYNREDIVNWKSYTYNNPQKDLDSHFETVEQKNWDEDEKDHPLDSLNSPMIKLSNLSNINYYDEIENDNCKRSGKCWFNDRIIQDKSQNNALEDYYPNINKPLNLESNNESNESNVYDEPDTSISQDESDTSATSQIKQILEVLVSSQKNVLEKLQKINL